MLSKQNRFYPSDFLAIMMVGLRSCLWKSPKFWCGVDVSRGLKQQVVGYAAEKGLSCLDLV